MVIVAVIAGGWYVWFRPGPPAVEPVPTAATSAIGTRADAVAYFEALGFTGSESPLLDGTPRWLGNRPSDKAGAEVIGAAAVDRVSLTIGMGAGSAEAAGASFGSFLRRFAPAGGTDFFLSVMDRYDGSQDFDETRDLGDRTEHVQTLTATDGVIVIVTVDAE